MSHKNNKNSKDNKKAGEKTKSELHKMKIETANEVGYSNESRKLGKDQQSLIPFNIKRAQKCSFYLVTSYKLKYKFSLG